MLGGYIGRILWVDLTAGKWHTEPVTEDMARKWVGGSGFAAYTVFKHVPASADPLGPENILCFFTGPLTGTLVTASSRHSVAAKSPLSGRWGEASVGGSWGRALKQAGYDGVVLTGRAAGPVYLWINDGKVEIRSAHELWGLDTYETSEKVKGLTHAKAEVCAIGPAGERLLPISGLFTDGHEGRTAARCGLGAVSGSKKVKAIAVYGRQVPALAEKESLREKMKAITPSIMEKAKGLRNFGTAGLVTPCHMLGDFPIKNWQDGLWEEGSAKISGPKLAETYLTGRFHCPGCVIGCGRQIAINTGPYAGVKGGGPEYETLGLFGASCLIDDLGAISYANELCNRYGIDTLEVGNLVAFSMEAYEKGIISKEETGGLEIHWGDPSVLIELIRGMGEGRGFGAILGDGFPAVVKRFGKKAKDIAMTVKGLGFPAHDPRAYNSVAVGYATANRGACHLEAFSHVFERNLSMPELGIEAPMDRFQVEGKGVLTAKAQNLMMIFDSLALCKFLLMGGIRLNDLVEWIPLVTGLAFSLEELMQCGERIFNLKRLFNVQCGASRKDDILPTRILDEKRGSGGAADNFPPLDKMLDEYYAYRGWDSNGIPTPDRLKMLGLSGSR
ncbi:MAG: aldehyde ferredoxin oxidoreductase family protein [Deltaproteobacteria bacterium]|nr:aldehyde ferredoxin oxidoreductase family protein [Deltaproteobacteria bacterium]